MALLQLKSLHGLVRPRCPRQGLTGVSSNKALRLMLLNSEGMVTTAHNDASRSADNERGWATLNILAVVYLWV